MFDEIAQSIVDQRIQIHGVDITVKRLDLVHPAISGNKFFKLKYNFIQAKKLGYTGVLTFGGAYSNHIAATAYAAYCFGFQSIGMIRGEELQFKALNHTLRTAQQYGMQFIFVSREEYRQKSEETYLTGLNATFPHYYIIPEGGTNALAIQGCKEILTSTDQQFDLICTAVGTGGTITGLIEATDPQQKVIGFSALKGNFLTTDVGKLTNKTHWQITDEFCCGGYTKTNPSLLNFIAEFEALHHIPLEHIYTAKMFYGLSQMILRQEITNQQAVLALHTGGLQGKLALSIKP